MAQWLERLTGTASLAMHASRFRTPLFPCGVFRGPRTVRSSHIKEAGDERDGFALLRKATDECNHQSCCVQHRPRYRDNYALRGQMSPFFTG